MQTYGNLVERMMEIIRLSEEKKNELDATELKNNFNEYFAQIQHCDIAIEYVNEFKELIDAERTFTLLTNESPFTYLDKTKDLLAICKENSNPANGNCGDYREIAQIISESYGKSAFELTEYKGYYILRDQLNRFLRLMRKLNLFASEKQLDNKAKIEEVNRQLLANQEQYYRLKDYFDQAKMGIVKSEIGSLNQNESFQSNFENKEFGDLILVGLNGDLTPEIVSKLRISYSDEQYQKLLDELLKWQILNEQEVAGLRHAEEKDLLVADTMDQIYAFLVTKEITDANALRLLTPAIGKENCMNLVERLYRAGSISIEVYEKFLSLEFGVQTKIMQK